jgi:hypothetical protein
MDAAAITTKSPTAAARTLDAVAITTKSPAAAAGTEFIEVLELTQNEDASQFTIQEIHTKHHSARVVDHIDFILDDDVAYISSHKVQPKRVTAKYHTSETAMKALLKRRREKSLQTARNHKRYKPTMINLTAMEDDDPAALTADPASDDSMVDDEETFYIGLTPPYYSIAPAAPAADPTSDDSAVEYFQE